MGRTEVDRTITSEPWSSTLGQRNRTTENALRSERRSSFQKRFDRVGVVRDVRLRRLSGLRTPGVISNDAGRFNFPATPHVIYGRVCHVPDQSRPAQPAVDPDTT